MSRWEKHFKSSLNRLKTSINEAKDIVEEDNVSDSKLQTCMKILTSYVKRIEEIHGKLEEQQISEVTTGSENDEDDDSDNFIITMMDYDEVMAKLEVRLDSMEISRNKTNEIGLLKKHDKTMFSFHNQSVRLPKLVIPFFNGDVLRWQEFWDSFESSIHNNPSLNNIDKFNYLIAQLEGEAKLCIEGLPLTGLNYDIAINLLKDRFANKKLIINSHYNALMLMLPIKTNETIKLRRGFDLIERHLRCLESLGEDISSNYFISLIISKLPFEIVLKVEEMNINNDMNVKLLCTCINKIISTKERSETLLGTSANSNRFVKITNSVPIEYSSRPTEPVSTAQALVGNNNVSCIFCHGTHWSDQCSNYMTVEERKNKIKGTCFKCLKKGHSLKQCKVTKQCVYCKQKNNHHRSLCTKQFPSEREPSKTSTLDSGGLKITIPVKTLPVLHKINSNTACISKLSNSVEESTLVSVNEQVILQTATVSLKNTTTKQVINGGVLFDTGSHRSYISKALASKLGLQGSETQILSLFTFGNQESKSIETQVVDVGLQLLGNTTFVIKANVVPHITGKVASSETVDITRMISLYPDLTFAGGQLNTTKVDLLIGNDYYFDLVTGDRIQISPGLYIVNTKFGWIVSGRNEIYSGKLQPYESSFLTFVQPNNVFFKTPYLESPDYQLSNDDGVKNLWRLETIGIHEDPYVKDDDIALNNFNKTIKFEDGRYSVTWPWMEYPPHLPTNYNLAFGRLKTLTNRLAGKPDLLREYDTVIKNQLKAGIIELVDVLTESKHVVHYIPHHPVVNVSHHSTKVRIVYDASAKTKRTNNSLNDCLYRGPVILENLCSLMLRFRMNAIGITADLEKAFLQINLQNPDRDVTRFLWLKDITSLNIEENIEEYRFCRVPFGVISSPFLLSATIKYHLSQNNSDQFSENLKSAFYVDNMVTGCYTEDDAVTLYETASKLFSDISMNLRSWCSNSTKLMSKIPTEKRTIENEINVNLLGLRWNTKDDVLCIKPVNCDKAIPVSKRNVLKTVSSIFDPLGLISPVVLKAKLFLKGLWEENINWDETLNEEKCNEWNIMLSDLLNIHKLHIPRYTGLKPTTVELHCFTDASKDVYSCSVYIRLEDLGLVKSTLMFCKSHLAPKSIKTITLPRLELLGVMIGTRALNFVENSLNIAVARTVIWTDSQCVLHWLCSTKILPKFVERRVKEIKANYKTVFKYIPTHENPVDIATRGTSVHDLTNCNSWWSGPHWLTLNEEQWPAWSFEPNELQEDNDNKAFKHEGEIINLTMKTDNISDEGPFGIYIERFSSLKRLLWTTIYCKRFIDKCKRKLIPKTVIPTTTEIEVARLSWEKYTQSKSFDKTLQNISQGKYDKLQTQLGLFLDNDGLVRCKGRLSRADIEDGCKYPKLLPKNDTLTQLIITDYHCKLYHVGVQHTLSEIRKEYWIIHGRSQVYKILRKCLICIKYEGGPYRLPQMPPLPQERVNISSPFCYTGLDYFGPLYVKSFSNSKEVSKVYGCIFTCLVTRAVHLEVSSDMTSEEFLMSLRRFVGRRGMPMKIILDNATQFKAASSFLEEIWDSNISNPDVLSYVSNNKMKFTFIPELAPWMGGFYERLISLVKRCLKKTIGSMVLTHSQLETMVTEIEAVINSRPLVHVSSNDLGLTDNIITPGHFLNFQGKNGMMSCLCENKEHEEDPDFVPTTSSNLLDMWKRGKHSLNNFWSLWKDDYLLSLRERTQTLIKQGRILSKEFPKLGDVVHVHENLPRGRWKIGKIEELYKSEDGNVRSARVMLGSRRCITRPISLLYPLEVTSSETTPREKSVQADTLRERRQAAVKANEKIEKWVQQISSLAGVLLNAKITT